MNQILPMKGLLDRMFTAINTSTTATSTSETVATWPKILQLHLAVLSRVFTEDVVKTVDLRTGLTTSKVLVPVQQVCALRRQIPDSKYI